MNNWTRIEDVFPIEHGDIPASYVSLPEGIFFAGMTPFFFQVGIFCKSTNGGR